MKRISHYLLSSLFIVSFACSDNKSDSESMDEAPVQELQASLDTPNGEVNSDAQVLAGQEGISSGQVQGGQGAVQQSNSIIPVNANQGQALNPAHGEPGHDCAIAVGAPLNSAKTGATQQIQPSTPSSSPVQIQANPSTTTPTATPAPVMSIPNDKAPAGTGGKLNPAHGEPGHDCAKPVGSPL